MSQPSSTLTSHIDHNNFNFNHGTFTDSQVAIGNQSVEGLGSGYGDVSPCRPGSARPSCLS